MERAGHAAAKFSTAICPAPSRVCQRSYAICIPSQVSGVEPNAFDSLIANSTETPVRPTTSHRELRWHQLSLDWAPHLIFTGHASGLIETNRSQHQTSYHIEMSGISVNNGRLERDQSVGIYPLVPSALHAGTRRISRNSVSSPAERQNTAYPLTSVRPAARRTVPTPAYQFRTAIAGSGLYSR